jgi:hypothetical protein
MDPGGVCTLEELGRAMINIAKNRPTKKVLEVKDIVQAAKS